MALDEDEFWIQKMHHDDNDALENVSDLCNNLPSTTLSTFTQKNMDPDI